MTIMFSRLKIIVLFYLMGLFGSGLAVSVAPQSNDPQVSGYGFASFPESLKGVVEAIYRLPEGRKLIEEASQQGKIRLALDKGAEFEAFWDSGTRTVALNPRKNISDGIRIASIVFELHNAKASNDLVRLTQRALKGHVTKEAYVEGIERLEHKNALAAARILKKGITQSFFPQEANWPVFRSFDDHYLVQQITGHSQEIARNYDAMRQGSYAKPYIGTLHTFKGLSEQGKEDLMRYLGMKNDLESSDEAEVARAKHFLKMELNDLAAHPNKERKALIRKVFKGNDSFLSLK